MDGQPEDRTTMSRTDVHAPCWVKERDPAWRAHFTETHQHHNIIRLARGGGGWTRAVRTFTGCDLDQFLAGARDTFCSMRYTGRRNIFCGCRLCTGHDWNRLHHQQQRAAWRITRQHILATHRHDPDADLDG